jgi:pimeloyl-ACP methyl ester carboxylesterase
VEDIDALIQQAGGSAFIFGTSSGACLALEAAMRLGERCKKLALYEPPYDSNESARPAWHEYRQQLAELPAADRRGEAVVPFMHATTSALAKAIPHAQQRTLEGQTHDVNLEVLAPVLVAFFSQ